jgi:hypothetical protein
MDTRQLFFDRRELEKQVPLGCTPLTFIPQLPPHGAPDILRGHQHHGMHRTQ